MEGRLAQVNRSLRATSRCNQTLFRVSDEKTLLDDICRIVVQEAGHCFCWVGFVEGGASGVIKAVASNGEGVDYLKLLRIDLGDATPEVTVPDGIELRPYQAADARAVYQVIEDAFNEWPDREPTTFEGWAAHVISHPAFAPELSRLAFEGSELVGVALCDDYEGQDEGWVPQVATKATHRHRGIARALLQSAFAAFHATGRRQVGLSTDTRTGALTLYERIGMRVRRTYTSWAKDLN